MATIILLNQSAASQRVVPLPPLVQSNGTSACTNESGATFFFSVGGVYYGSGGSISAISAPMGLYECLFAASKVSVIGQGRVMYSSGTALPASTPIDIVKYDSYDSTRLGLFALPNSAPNVSGGLPQLGTDYGSLFTVGVSNIKAATYSGVTIDGLSRINSSVTIANATYSAVTLRLDSVDYSSLVTVGVGNIKAASYSGVSVEVKTGGIQTASVGAGSYSGMSVEVKTGGIQTTSVGVGSYSGVTFETSNIKPGTYSGVSVEVKSGGIQTASVGAGSYSGVSVEVKSGGIQAGSVGAGNYSGMSVEVKTGGIQTTSIGKGSYSGVSVEVTTGGIQTASVGAGAYSGVTVDGAKFLSAAGERSAASSLLSTNVGNTRLVQEYLWPLRNRVQISGSTMTVFMPDDTTSSWTASVTTSVAALSGIDPAG